MGHLKMKRIINTSTRKTLWRGTDYLVDGIPATVEPPLYLLTDATRPTPDYDASTHRLQSVPAHADLAAEEWVTSSYEAVELSPADITANAYSTARSNLATYWSSQPAWIRGPFDASYQSAVALLDRHDIDAAIAIITYAPIPIAYDADQVSTFETVRATLLAGLQALPVVDQP
jgi:hypothetical protein